MLFQHRSIRLRVKLGLFYQTLIKKDAGGKPPTSENILKCFAAKLELVVFLRFAELEAIAQSELNLPALLDDILISNYFSVYFS